MKRYTLLDQPAEMAESTVGEFVRLEDLSSLLEKCRAFAEFHEEDNDEWGTLAREVMSAIDALNS